MAAGGRHEGSVRQRRAGWSALMRALRVERWARRRPPVANPRLQCTRSKEATSAAAILVLPDDAAPMIPVGRKGPPGDAAGAPEDARLVLRARRGRGAGENGSAGGEGRGRAEVGGGGDRPPSELGAGGQMVSAKTRHLEVHFMALTLTEAAKLSNDTLLAGVIETMAEESPILQRLPFIEITGNGLTYNREDSAPDAGFYGVGDDWDEGTPTFTQQTASLKILGGDADIDNFLKETRSNVQDLEAAVLQLKARAVQALFDKTFVTGNATTDSDSFDGVDRLCANDQAVSMGANGGTLTLARLDELIDRVRPGKPQMLLMSRRSRRKLNELARAAGTFLEAARDQFGGMVQYYDGIPIGINDYISDAQTAGTSRDASTVYAMQFGEGALAGLSAPSGLSVDRVGALESKDATRLRVKWYAGLALFNTLALAKLTGVRP